MSKAVGVIHTVKRLLEIHTQQAGRVVTVVKSTEDVVPNLDHHMFRAAAFFPTILAHVRCQFSSELLKDHPL